MQNRSDYMKSLLWSPEKLEEALQTDRVLLMNKTKME